MSTAPSNPLPAIIEHMTKYVALPKPEQALVLGLWVIHTWTFSESVTNPHTTPYIYVHSPEKQSGKTRLIEVLENIVRNPMRATDMSPSVLFRSIGAMSPTILLDEVDAIWSGAKNEEMRGTLNGGYKRGGHVWRIEQGTDGKEPTQFPTFCPKLLAGIDNGLLPDTIRDRSIPIVLQRKQKETILAPFFSYTVEPEAAAVVEQIDAWVRHHNGVIGAPNPEPITTISDRAWEITMPLVTIANLMGKQIEKDARAAIAELLMPTDASLTPGEQLLTDIREAFMESGTDRLFSSQIIAKLGEGWNGKLLGNRLRPYQVQPGTIRIGNQTAKGFYKRQFQELWERYL